MNLPWRPHALLLALPLLTALPSHASNSAWTAVTTRPAAPAELTLTEPPLYRIPLPAGQLQGRWVRAAARFQGPAGEVMLNIVSSTAGRRGPGSLPAICQGRPSDRTCEAVAWIAPGTDDVRMVAWSAETPTTVTALRVEVATGSRRQTQAARRLDLVFQKTAELYHRSSEVDWASLRRTAEPALVAPTGLDPVPWIMSSVLRGLPGGQHSSVRLKPSHQRGPQALPSGHDEVSPMPVCRTLADDVHLLALPGTPETGTMDELRYLGLAQQCLLAQPAHTRWILDLRECSGGWSDLAIAALAPLLRAGELLSWRNRQGEWNPVTLSEDGVRTGGRLNLRRELPVGQRATAPTLVWIGPGTASACEALAAAMTTRPETRLVGQPTAGLATPNEALPLSSDYWLVLTTGRMWLGGHPLEDDRLRPATVLDDVTERDLLPMFDRP